MELENVRVGDELIRVASPGHYPTVVTVDRVVATQIIVGETRFNKRTQREIGTIGGWNRDRLRLPRDGEVAKLKLKQLCQTLRCKIAVLSKRVNLAQLPLEALNHIYVHMEAVYDAHKINPS